MSSGPLKAGDLFPLAYNYAPDLRCQFTGEVRPPKAGEWFISGAIPEGYQAGKSDLTQTYCIGKLVKVRTYTVTEVIGDEFD